MNKIIVVLLIAFSAVTQAEDKKQTKIDFEDLIVKGKHHFAGEAVVTVENDKVLNALLKVRKDFKDRVERSSGLR